MIVYVVLNWDDNEGDLFWMEVCASMELAKTIVHNSHGEDDEDEEDRGKLEWQVLEGCETAKASGSLSCYEIIPREVEVSYPLQHLVPKVQALTVSTQ